MKIKTLCTTALVAITGVAVLSATTASAESFLDGEGKVKIEQGTLNPNEGGIIDPENPDKELPSIDPEGPGESTNPDTNSSMMIEKISTLNFGTIKTATSTVTSKAAATKHIDETGTKVTRGAYVQWSDIRSGAEGYTVQAKMTRQFTSGTNTLKNATIDFTNGILAQSADNTNVKPGVVASSLTLDEESNAVTVVTADPVKKEGKGQYILEFGQTKGYNGATEDTTGTAVTLTIPGATAANMAVGDYTSTIQWNIVAAE